MLVKALETVGLTEGDVTIVNTSDADMISAFRTPEVTAAVTCNPAFAAIKSEPGAHSVYDSSQMPGELVDVMMVNTETLKANPAFGVERPSWRRGLIPCRSLRRTPMQARRHGPAWQRHPGQILQVLKAR